MRYCASRTLASHRMMVGYAKVSEVVAIAGAVLFTTVSAWFFFAFPSNFAHLTEIVPVSFRFLFSWINDDIGRIMVGLALIGGVIFTALDSVELVWRVTLRRLSRHLEMTLLW